MAMLISGFLCFAAIVRYGDMPQLLAFGRADTPSAPDRSDSSPSASNDLDHLSLSSILTPPVASDASKIEWKSLTLNTPAPPAIPAIVKQLAPKPKKAAVEFKTFKGEKYKYVRTLRLRVTAYAPDARCCWPFDGTTTASGLSVKTNRGRLVAADTRLIPMHSLVSVPGYDGGAAVPVLDRGGAIKGHRLDVLLPTFEQAKEWGSRVVDVKIYEVVDGRE